MEQPPGTLEDVQPEDLSTSGSVMDLTRRRDECVLNAAAMVKSPGWFPSSGNPASTFSQSGASDVPTGERVQPDDAFSHTTVTLSYVSRSHVFSTPDALPRHSPRSGAPPIGRFSLQPPCDSEKRLEGDDYSLNQHYSEQEDRPVDLAARPELLQTLSQAGPEDNGGERPSSETHEYNGGVVASDGDEQKMECISSVENCWSLENGRGDSGSSIGVCAVSSPETLTPAPPEEVEEEKGDAEVLFLMSRQKDPVIALETVAARDLCALSREYISPLEDPVSPSATSLDNVEGVFLLPQASCSPSGDVDSYPETTEEAVRRVADAAPLESSGENKQRVRRRKAVLEPLIDLTDDDCELDALEAKNVVPHVNGSTKAPQRTLKEKKLPMRASRGTRLDAIVMNINSGRYKVSGCIRTSKKAGASPSTGSDSKSKDPQGKDSPSSAKRRSRTKTATQKAGTPVKMEKTNNMNTDAAFDSTLANSKKSRSGTPPKSPPHKSPRKKPKDASQPAHSPEKNATPSPSKRPPPSRPQSPAIKNSKTECGLSPPKKSPAKGQAAGCKTTPAAKAKRRRKKPTGVQASSLFSPKEPEIKLKYLTYKEERRDPRLDGFSPFVRLQRRPSSTALCAVINEPEEVRTPHRKCPQQHLGDFISAAVPSTSCLQLGRASAHGQHRRALACCLCGRSANAMDLGDLHGPYFPEGYRPGAKTPAGTPGLKEEEESSDSDSSSCSLRGGRSRKQQQRAVPPTSWSYRPGAQLRQTGLPEEEDGGDGVGSPAARRPRTDACGSEAQDWYSPPVLPMESCEYWLHEDCGIWSAGVFLVKGKVYGLEEAAKAGQETLCSACRDPGATLGCFFKACPNKYHYRCALQSDCVLIEENFSMKCKKHKNKTFKGPPGNRWDDR